MFESRARRHGPAVCEETYRVITSLITFSLCSPHSLRSLREELTVEIAPSALAPPAEFRDSSARLEGPVFTQRAWSEKVGVSVDGEEACRDVEEAFAGARILAASRSSPALANADGTATIRSRSGTIRGVRNRVRQGIATFLKDPNKKVGR